MRARVTFAVALCLLAVGAATFAVGFRASLSLLYRVAYGADNVVDAITNLNPWLRLLVPVAGATVAGLIARWRHAPAQGVSNVMEAVALGRVQLSLRTTASRVASSWSAIATGLSIGREGPLIEVGGSLGAALGRAFATPLDQTRVLVAAGTAAGFAAAYNTPLAAVLFVIETIVGIAAPDVLLSVMATTFIATAMTRAIVGAGPIYGQRAFGLNGYVDFFWFATLGLAAALAAVGFKRLLELIESAFERYPVPQPWRAMLGGLVVGAIAIYHPNVAGNGYEPLNAMLNAPMLVRIVAVLALAKVIATSASVGSGIPGGVFTPMLLVGASLGTLWSHLTGGNAGSYALVGMAAATAASIHAPLTATVMIFELSGDYAIVLPLLLVTIVATTASKSLGSESVYEAELRRRGLGWDLTLEGRHIRK
jgi:chloride channel protein, CIC family